MHKTNGLTADLGLLALRLTAGGLLAGHGAQKLFGSFGGSGLEGTAGWLESLELSPGRPWAMLAGGSELASGLLTALGLLHPVGPLASLGPMAMAWSKVHAGKPIWVTSGGAELPLLNIVVASTLTLVGPGRLTLDRLLGLRASTLLVAGTVAGVAAGVAAGALSGQGPAPELGDADQPDPGVGLSAPVVPTLENAGLRLDEEGERGAEAYGGIGEELPPELPELAKEVGADPPGAFPAWGASIGRANPRPAGDTHGDDSEPHARE
jgi:putative oxidoreductase